jgi:hypothetical protein
VPRPFQIRNKINLAGKQSRRTRIVVQIGIASALAPDRVPGGVLRPGELRGTSRVQVDWARSDRTTAPGGDDTHGDIESMHDGDYIYILSHSVPTREVDEKTRAHHRKCRDSPSPGESTPPRLQAAQAAWRPEEGKGMGM